MVYSATTQRKIVTPASEKIMNRKDYVILDGRDHPDLLVSMHRLTLSEALPGLIEYDLTKTLLERAGRDKYQNQRPLDPSGFLGYLRHDEAKRAVSYENEMFIPGVNEFTGFIRLLRSGKAIDGNGKRISRLKVKKILDDIVEQRDPWRGEHLGSSFKEIAGKMYVISSRDASKEPLDEDTLMEDRIPGISLEDWINNPTKQGLPKKNVKSGNLWYRYPRNGSVAWFYANSLRVYLNCDGDSLDSDPALGVRVARVKE